MRLLQALRSERCVQLRTSHRPASVDRRSGAGYSAAGCALIVALCIQEGAHVGREEFTMYTKTGLFEEGEQLARLVLE